MKRFTGFITSASLILILSLSLSLLSSCTTGDSGKKPSTGAVNELLIVTNDKTQWEGALGDTLRAFFAANLVGLSQPEPAFDMVNIADENLSEIFIKFHNIFIADINPQITEAKTESNFNLWAEPQRVIKVSAPDLLSFYHEFNLKKDGILKQFDDLERQRTLHINQLDMDYKMSNTVRSKFGISLPFPEGFYVAKEAPDFMWLRYTLAKAKRDVELGIMIYSMDYNDTVVFNPRHILQWRNTLTREHIPGPSPNSFMKVAGEFIPPVFDTITDFPGGYTIETRGLWEVENDFMGGPFISYTFTDPAHKRVITLDGYVFNPNEEKKNFLRQLEAIFFSLKFAEQQ
jgi:hypothetical protein